MSEIEIARCACANCDWKGGVDEATEVRDFWSRVVPGDTVPAGECPECECLVYLIEGPPEVRPLRVYLNIAGGEGAADHLLAIDVDFNRLQRLSRLVAALDLDSVAIRPAYELFAYEGCTHEPTDGFIASAALSEFEDHHHEDRVPGAEPTLRLDGFVLRIAADGYCYGEGAAKHSDASYATEAFLLQDVVAHLADASTPAGA